MKSAPGNPVHQQTVRFYDVEAGHYDASRYQSKAGQRVDAFHKRILEENLFGKLPADARVLELGCGTGRLLRHFSPRFPNFEGMDASGGMLAVAKRAAKSGRASLVQGSAYALPYASGAFDAVYAVLVINLLAQYPAALAEVSRILRPGGRFVFNVPNLHSMYWPGGALVNLRGRTTGRNSAGTRHSHWFTRSEILSELDRARLHPVELLGQPPLLSVGALSSPLPGTLPYSLLCKSLYVVAEKRA